MSSEQENQADGGNQAEEPRSERDLLFEHDRLIGLILAEEEELISSHREQLQESVALLNEEMAQVNLIDQPGSDVDKYVKYMDSNLARKEKQIFLMRAKLNLFKEHLNEEESLSVLMKKG